MERLAKILQDFQAQLDQPPHLDPEADTPILYLQSYLDIVPCLTGEPTMSSKDAPDGSPWDQKTSDKFEK